MPKPSSAEVYPQHTDLQVLVCDQVKDGHGLLDSHYHITQPHRGHDELNGPGSDPGSGVEHTDAPASSVSSTSFVPPRITPPTTSEESPVCALAPSSFLGCSSESTQPSSSPSFLTPKSTSQFTSEGDSFLQDQNHMPEEVKETPIRDDGYCAIKKREIDCKDGDGDCPVGPSIEGHEKGRPNHHVPSDVDKEFRNKYIRTIIGSSMVQRPFDTCFGTDWARGDGKLPPPNRTYANDFIVVSRSPLHGHGIFAAVDIKKHTHVLFEEPFFTIKGWTQLDSEYAGLGEVEKAVFDGLVGYHRVYKDPVLRKFSANTFEFAYGRQGILAIASNFNHACHSRRNTQYAWDACQQVMTFTVMKDIRKGEELLISYNDLRCALYSLYGFICQCGGCNHQEYDNQYY